MPGDKPTPGHIDHQQTALIPTETRRNRRLLNGITKLQDELRQQPGNAELHFRLARALLRGGQSRQAERSLLETIRLNPAQPAAWVQLGALLERRRAYADAVRLLQEATKRFPDEPDLWLKLGRSLRRQEHADEAASALSNALRLAPASAEAQYELGLGLHLLGKLTEARYLLRQSLLLGPANVSCRAALASVESALFPPVAQVGGRSAARVALHMNQAFHYSILDPVLQALKANHPVLLATEPALLQKFCPEIVVVADAQGQRLRSRFPKAIFILVRHGLISKRHQAEAAAGCDFVAGISSDTIRHEFASQSGIPAERIWVTGHVPMDPLFRREQTDADQVPLPRGNKTVLFAPTWNRRLSALGLLGRQTVDLLLDGREDINLIIKPHPTTIRDQGDWMSALRQAARGRKNVWLIEDLANDGMALLPLADVLVSDACSLIFAFLTCDRPLVLVTHHDRKQDPAYDENGIEWRWRDVGEEIMDIKKLPAAIQLALQEPEKKSSERARYRQLLFGDYTDGHAAERIAARIGALPRRDPAQA